MNRGQGLLMENVLSNGSISRMAHQLFRVNDDALAEFAEEDIQD
jgi:hypothetical protein